MRKLSYSDIKPYLEYIDVHNEYGICGKLFEHFTSCAHCPFSGDSKLICDIGHYDNHMEVVKLLKVLKAKHPELFI